MIPITRVDVRDSESLVLEVLRSGSIAQGPMVARLESEFAAAIGVKHCIAVNNGTTALVAALEVCDLRPGDEVITSPFTFVATLNAALEAGATVRFADINESDFAIDPASVESRLSSKSAVLMPVHLYGQCADMTGIMRVAESNGLKVVEDAAQAHGAKFKGTSAGAFGIGCFSLYATKNLTSGEGGLITTDDDVVADRLRVLRNQGMRERYKYEVIGHNYRMTDIHAAIAIPQVAHMYEIAASRRSNAEFLRAALGSLPGVRVPEELDNRAHVWHQFTIVLSDDAKVSRDEFISKMTERGIGCGAYYPRLAFDYECFRNDERVVVEDVPRATAIAKGCVSLPVHQYLSVSELEAVAESAISILA